MNSLAKGMTIDRQKLLEIGSMILQNGQAEYVYSVEHIEAQVGFYTRFLGRTGLLAHHREQADRILDGYIFELAFRDGIYDEQINKIEDETCDAA